jgi:hypothetical protein
MIKYTDTETGNIIMEKDGVISTVPKDPANSDYQRYLNPEAEDFTPNLPA